MTQYLVCITKDDYYLATLTPGKIYKGYYNNKQIFYSSQGIYYTITNDINIKSEYHESLFITIQQWRQSQLNQILN